MSKSSTDRIDEIRKEIDLIDDQLLKLFNERASLAIDMGQIKIKKMLDIYDPDREFEIIEMMLNQNCGPLDEKAVKGLFQRVIDESRRVEKFSVSEEETLETKTIKREIK